MILLTHIKLSTTVNGIYTTQKNYVQVTDKTLPLHSRKNSVVFFIANETYCFVLILSVLVRQSMLCGIIEAELMQRDNNQPYV